MIHRYLAAVFLLFAFPVAAETVTFPASDGVTVTADLANPGGKPLLVLFHMAGSSRGEYRDIAPRLNALGYATLAVDQRSGGAFNGIENVTAARFGSNPGYQAAILDLVAATDYAQEHLKATRVGVIGSSYSASLILVLAGQDQGFADAIMAFSPGEYFSNKGMVAMPPARSRRRYLSPPHGRKRASGEVFSELSADPRRDSSPLAGKTWGNRPDLTQWR